MSKRVTIKALMAEGRTRDQAKACVEAFYGRGPTITYTPPRTPLPVALERELDDAESKAWDSLARYKFAMFGYWAGVWVHLNRVGDFKRANPWRSLVHLARQRKGSAA